MASKPKRKPLNGEANISRLSDFAKALDEMAERKREEDLRIAKQAKRDLPVWLKKLKRLSADELFEQYDTCLQGAYSNHHLMRVMSVYRGKVKAEMLRRMEG